MLSVTPPSPRGRLWSGWQTLPRETRDTLFLLGVIAWVIAPHAGQLPFWCTGLAGVVLLWRAHLALNGAALPGRWTLLALLLASLGATWFSHRTLLGQEAGVTLVAVLITLKTLELRARRDAFVVFFLGFFLVLTHFLYSQSIFIALNMLLAVWGLLTALVLAHMPVGQPSLRAAGGIAARMTAFGAPVMAALFLLFPRVGPLWALPQDAASGRTGLSDTMTLGQVAKLAQDDRIAMRLRFDGQPPAPETLYFRGPVLSRFDGREWRPLFSGNRPVTPQDGWRLEGPGVGYELTLEPSSLRVLPLLELTPEPPAVSELPLELTADLLWRTPRPPMERLRLKAHAYPRHAHGPLQFEPELQEHLQLPDGYNPRTLAWAAELKRQPRHAGADADALAEALLQHIRTQPFRYTLSPGLYGDAQGRHAIDEFWLDRREGFCEHYAAAFVVAMRALGVPARIVTGYQGAELNPVDGYWLVRQSHAHAWAEYWQAGRGWVRADPTAAVAPERIERTAALQAPPGLMADAFDAVAPTLLRRLRNTLEALDNGWNQWVLNYARGQQMELLKGLGFRTPSFEHLGYLLAGLIAAATLLGSARLLWQRLRRDPWLRALDRMRHALRHAGLDAPATATPRQLAERARAQWGDPAQPVVEVLLTLEALRYASGAPGGTSGARQAATLVRKLGNALYQARAPVKPSRP